MLLKKFLKEVKTSYVEIAKKIIYIFSFCLLISVSLIVFVAGAEDFAWRSDFASFITGARIIRFGEAESLYDLSIQQKHQLLATAPNKQILLPFRNLPVLALVFVPFTYLSIFPAYKIYTSILVFVTLFISWFSTKAFKNLKQSYWFLLPFIFYPSLVAIFTGQISTFLILIYLLLYYFLKNDRHFTTGIVVGLLLLKTQYIISLPFVFLLVKDKKEFLKGFLITSFLILLGSISLSGLGFFENYLKMLVSTESSVYGTRDTCMFSLVPALSQITSFTKKSLIFVNFILYVLAVWFFYKIYRDWSLEISFVVTILFTLVFCIHGGNVDMALLVVPLWLLIDICKSSRGCALNNVIVIFILIFSSLFFILKISFAIPFLFLLSVALLYMKINFRGIHA